MPRGFITMLDKMTDLVVGESKDVDISIPLILLYAEERGTITGNDYDRWVEQARALILIIKEIDKNLKQIGGHKGTKLLQTKI